MRDNTSSSKLLRGEPISIDQLRDWSDVGGAPRTIILHTEEFLKRWLELAQVDAPLHIRLSSATIDRQLVTTLAQLSRLVSLDLSENDLGDEAVHLLFSQSHRNLQWLSLSYNRVGEDGVRYLAWAWRDKAPHLTYVDLVGNPCDPKDEIWYEDGYVAVSTPFAQELEKDGAIPWLHYHIEDGRIITPDRFALKYQASPLAAAHTSK